MACLIFSVNHVYKHLVTKSGLQIYKVELLAAVYLTAVLEYITEEAMDLACHTAKQFGVSTIVPRHIMLAICTDEEMNHLFRGSIYVDSGVVPNINKNLIDEPTHM